uniref:C2 domain-containing protein n=1 Tax=Ornithorhynchus anatinus TaxID=9258 RepID=A0A6I8N1Z9_ORNAN
MENLFLSLTTQMKKISKSQNDMTTGRGLLTTNYERSLGRQNERRSQSDTAINLTKQIESSPNLLQLINQENLKTSTNITWRGKEDGSSSPTHSTVFLGGRKHGSLLSLNSTCTEAGNFEKADVTGEIEFAIRYIFKTRTLEVCIKACKNLAYGEEKKKKCNPYVKAYLLPDKSSQGKRKTSVKKNTVDPAFHETLKYLVDHAQLVTRLLQISVWHRGTLTRRVFLGEVLVPLTSWNFEDHTTQAFRWYQLKAKAEGCNDDPDHYPGELTPWAKPITPAMGSKSRSEKLGPGGRHVFLTPCPPSSPLGLLEISLPPKEGKTRGWKQGQNCIFQVLSTVLCTQRAINTIELMEQVQTSALSPCFSVSCVPWSSTLPVSLRKDPATVAAGQASSLSQSEILLFPCEAAPPKYPSLSGLRVPAGQLNCFPFCWGSGCPPCPSSMCSPSEWLV